jgi:ribosome-associated toxin RatA of RatAB toxin-antitoxin module
MAEKAKETTVMRASPDRLYETVLDFERYPEWAADIKHVQVLERDDQGRGLVVEWRAAGFGRSTRYVLRYDYEGAPREVAWVLDHGDITSKLDGSYVFDAVNGGDQTQVTYYLEAELKIPLPGFIKRRAEQRIMAIALKELKARVER